MISETFLGLEDDLDAAFSYADDGVIFLKGSQCWKFNGNTLEAGYPKDISSVFPGIPSNIQAATRMGTKGYIYFFKGNYLNTIHVLKCNLKIQMTRQGAGFSTSYEIVCFAHFL